MVGVDGLTVFNFLKTEIAKTNSCLDHLLLVVVFLSDHHPQQTNIFNEALMILINKKYFINFYFYFYLCVCVLSFIIIYVIRVFNISLCVS